jgi:hypothetical protein
MKAIPRMQKIKVGDNHQLELFKAEASSNDKGILQDQQLVLNGVDKEPVVKERGEKITIFLFPGGQELAVPTKYLVFLP